MPSPLNNKLNRLIAAFLAVAAVALAVGVIASLEPKPKLPAPLMLATGETVTLRGITYGTNHSAPFGPGWMRLLPSVVRSRLLPLFVKTPVLFWDRTTVEPKMLLWLEVRNHGATNPPAPSATQTWLMLADDHGQAAGGRENVNFISGPGFGASYGVVVEFGALPRRAKKIEAQWLQGVYNDVKCVAQWELPNPAPSPAPSWPAEILPAARSDGDLECTLERLLFGAGSSSRSFRSDRGTERREFPPAKPGEEIQAVAQAFLREQGKLTTNWSIAGVTLADASGNLATARSISTSPAGKGWASASFGPVLWPSETWEVRLSAKRAPSAPFAPEELAEFKDIPIQGLDVPTGLSEQRTSAGVRLQLTRFTLREPPPPNGSWSTANVSELKVLVSGLTNGVYLDLLKAVDEKGNPCVPSSWSSSSSGGRPVECSYSFLSIPVDARRLSFTFAVQRGREFRFRVQPEVAATNMSLDVPGD